jgi:hypothetical protein
LPSWVPDFGAKRFRRLGIIEGDWNAGKNRRHSSWTLLSPYISGHTLICDGFVVEAVVGLGAISSRDMDLVVPRGSFPTGVVQPGSARTRLQEAIDEYFGDMLGTRIPRDSEVVVRELDIYRVMVGGQELVVIKPLTSFGVF